MQKKGERKGTQEEEEKYSKARKIKKKLSNSRIPSGARKKKKVEYTRITQKRYFGYENIDTRYTKEGRKVGFWRKKIQRCIFFLRI